MKADEFDIFLSVNDIHLHTNLTLDDLWHPFTTHTKSEKD